MAWYGRIFRASRDSSRDRAGISAITPFAYTSTNQLRYVY